MSDLRCLTVRQPWGAAIIYLDKGVENRGRNIAGTYRGPVAIHTAAPKRDDATYISAAIKSPYFDTAVLRERYTVAQPDPWWGFVGVFGGLPLVMGAVIGVVDLVDVHQDVWSPDGCRHLSLTDDPLASTLCSPWAMPGHHHLVLANPRPLARPIPAKGRLGLWRPDETLAAAIREQADR